MRRIVITGMGAICALGHDAASTWKAMTQGRSGIGTIERVPAELLRAGGVVAQIKGFDPLARIAEQRAAMMDLAGQYALVAADEAIAQSGIPVFAIVKSVIVDH